MKYRDIQVWTFNEDVHATLEDFQIETKKWSQQDIDNSIAELGKMVLILSAVMAVWFPLLCLLWP